MVDYSDQILESCLSSDNLSDIKIDEAAIADPFGYINRAYYESIINFSKINMSILIENYMILKEDGEQQSGESGGNAPAPSQSTTGTSDNNTSSTSNSNSSTNKTGIKDKIKNAANWAIEKIKNFFGAIRKKFVTAWNKLQNMITTFGKKIPASTAVTIKWYPNNTKLKTAQTINATLNTTLSGYITRAGKLKPGESGSSNIADEQLKTTWGISGDKQDVKTTAGAELNVIKDFGSSIRLVDSTCNFAISRIRAVSGMQVNNSSTSAQVNGMISAVMKYSSYAYRLITERVGIARDAYKRAGAAAGVKVKDGDDNNQKPNNNTNNNQQQNSNNTQSTNNK